MKQIAVIGAGTMGNGIAHTFAQSGFTVKLIDISEKSLEKGTENVSYLGEFSNAQSKIFKNE